MDAYCQRQGLSNNQCRFIFDGERIKEDDTPDTLEMENGDEIDVMVKRLKAMSHGLRHAAACPAESHAQCPSFQRLLKAAAVDASPFSLFMVRFKMS